MLAVKRLLKRLVERIPGVEGRVWLIAILALAGGLRLARIGVSSLWADEAFSWLVARQPAWAILTQRLEPILPPLYHFLLHFWITLGESEVVLRSFSALCGLLTIPVIYVTGRSMFTPLVGLLAALFTAVLPFHVYFAQEARLYALVVFLSALLLWRFICAWQGGQYWQWGVVGLVVAVNLYAHYFTVFTLIVLHSFVVLKGWRERRSWWGVLLSDGVALVLWAPFVPSVLIQIRQVTTNFWLAMPSVLEPVKTLDYLLFAHTTPIYLNPIALFVTLSIFVLVAYAGLRAPSRTRAWIFLLLGLILAPMGISLLLSWLMAPVYLDRSFSLVTPAYVLFLGWGMARPPRGSPVRVLYGGLAVLLAISLGNYYVNPDPAKPPFRDVAAVVRENWRQDDVLFHLHDSSYLPMVYYAPDAEAYLLNNDPETWLPPYTWDWAGQRVFSPSEVISGHKRLWLVDVETYLSRPLAERNQAVWEQIEGDYACQDAGRWYGVWLTLCDLQAGHIE